MCAPSRHVFSSFANHADVGGVRYGPGTCASLADRRRLCEPDSMRGCVAHFYHGWLCMPYVRETVRAVVRVGQEIMVVSAPVCSLSLHLLWR